MVIVGGESSASSVYLATLHPTPRPPPLPPPPTHSVWKLLNWIPSTEPSEINLNGNQVKVVGDDWDGLASAWISADANLDRPLTGVDYPEGKVAARACVCVCVCVSCYRLGNRACGSASAGCRSFPYRGHR